MKRIIAIRAFPAGLFSSNRKDLGWLLSYVYLFYIFIGQLPFLREMGVFSTIISSFLMICIYVISSILILGLRSSAKFFIIAAVVGSGMELLSLDTGFPFGRYYYTAELGPLLGQLPVFIPLLWASLSFYAYMAGGRYGMPFLMVFMDLALDPRLSGHLWIWVSSTQYFGDPVTNFVGWFVTAAIIILFFSMTEMNTVEIGLPAIGFYALSGLNECILDIYAELQVPALISAMIFVASTLVLLYLYRRKKHERTVKGDGGHSPSEKAAS